MARKDIQISRDRVLNLMRHLGLRASKQKPRTSVPGNPAEQLPCVVDLSQIFAVDQVWAKDITYIRPQIGFLNLLAIVALCCRNVLDWKLSQPLASAKRYSLGKDYCLDVLEMALASDRRHEIFHSDQGCQFTSGDFVTKPQAEGIKVSWSGWKRCYNDMLVVRLWLTVKQEEVYLHPYSDGWEVEISLAGFLWRYCRIRPHSRGRQNSP